MPDLRTLWLVLVEAFQRQGLDLPDPLTPTTRMDDLHADTLDLIEVLMTIEDRLGLPVAFFDEQAFCECETLGEAEALLAAAVVHHPYVM